MTDYRTSHEFSQLLTSIGFQRLRKKQNRNQFCISYINKIEFSISNNLFFILQTGRDLLGALYFGIIEGMKIYYLEGKSVLQNQELVEPCSIKCMHLIYLSSVYDRYLGDYDVVHINTYGPQVSFYSMQQASWKKVIMHGHSTREDLKIPLSGLTFTPLFGKYLAHMYQKADYVITPSRYSNT